MQSKNAAEVLPHGETYGEQGQGFAAMGEVHGA